MKQILVVLIALLALAPAVAGMGDTSPGIDDGADYQLLNPGFIPNVGQYDPGVEYILQHREATVFFTRDGLVLAHTSGDVIRQSFAGASPDVNLTAGDQRPGAVNYYVGNDSSKWLSGIPVYSGIVYGDLYPGIDLVYTGEDGRLKREFHVSAGADPSQIELVYEGERAPHVDDDGVLRFASPAGEMLESPLVCWQVIDDERIDRVAEYVVDCGSVRIAVAEYDSGHELIIDPELVYSSYLGGNRSDDGYALVPDGSGGVWVTGYTWSADFPTSGAHSCSYGGSCDVFISHFSSDGDLLSSTYLGGTSYDHGFALANDDDGGVWVTGYTSSPNFPVKNAYQSSPSSYGGGWREVFVSRISSSGDLLSSTYLGGGGDDYGYALASDGDGGVWVTGMTRSDNFPIQDASQKTFGGSVDAFISYFSPSGDLLLSTYLGGDSVDLGHALVPDGSGGVWVMGSTTSTNFPTKDAYQSNYGGGYGEDLFIARFGTDDPVLILPPVADFTANVTSGVAPLTVRFTDTSTDDPTAWSWFLGDGTTSTEQNPAHTYENAGTYTVTLTATNDGGSDTETRTDYITVTPPPPAAGFTADPTVGNASLTVQFTDQSAGDVTAWAWDFGDGNTSTVQHPAHTYESAGRYNVTLNASNVYGYNLSSPATITVLESLVADFTADPTVGNAPLTVRFTDESTGDVTAWLWDFGDGKTSTVQNPIHTYESAGTYTVSLNASNAYGYSIISTPTTITVLKPPGANFTMNVTGGNAPLTVQLTDQSSGNVTSWHWDFSDGNTSTVQNPVHTYESAGTYTVSLNASNAYGYNLSSPATITVLDPLAANFTANVTAGVAPLAVQFTDNSAGSPTAWNWFFGDGNTSVVQNPVHIYTIPGTYTVNLTVTTTGTSASISRPGYITVTVKGDLNGDGTIDIGDVAKVAYMVVGKEPADLAADFNGNGRVDIGDAAKIAYFFVGKVDTL